MAKGKVTLQMLSEMMANNTGRSKSATEQFVRNFFSVLKEALQRDNIIKIKGFGTFKMVVVNARESVNVNTGERVSIAEYNKITFTPDKSLKERINRPFAQFDTITLDDEDLEIVEGKTTTPQSIETKPQSVSGYNQTETPETANATVNPATPIPAPLAVQPEAAAQPIPIVEKPQEVVYATEEVVEPAAEHAPVAIQIEESKAEVETVASEEVAPQTDNDDIAPEVAECAAEDMTPQFAGETEAPLQPEPQVEQEAQQPMEAEPQPRRKKAIATKERNSSRRTWIVVAIVEILIGLGAFYFMRMRQAEQKDIEAQQASEVLLESDTIAPPSAVQGEEEAKAAYEMGLDSVKAMQNTIAEYPQLENGKYYIVGVKTTRKIKPNYDIRRWCRQIYGRGDIEPYVRLLNNCEGKTVPVGTILKFPLIVEK